MSTKNNPNKAFDCYFNAEPDEPMFILLGRDRMAPALVEIWASLRQAAGEPVHVVQEAIQCVDAMRQWLYAHQRQEVRALDTLPADVLVAALQRRGFTVTAPEVQQVDLKPETVWPFPDRSRV